MGRLGLTRLEDVGARLARAPGLMAALALAGVLGADGAASLAAAPAHAGGAQAAVTQTDGVQADGGAAPAPKRITRAAKRLERKLSWGVVAIRADLAHARGITGTGVIVAMIDTGLGTVPEGMFGRLSPASIDLNRDRAQRLPPRHGEQTGTLLAAQRDGRGTFGVAYGATLLSIRADLDGSCDDLCSVRGRDLARGIDYAVAQGAKVIGVPLVGRRPLPSIEPALARATAAGVVIVAAAGNDAAEAPSWPARYAADPRFARAIVVAGASTIGGAMATWSSRASGTVDRYVVAPGENVVVDCDDVYCRLVSGTSYSVSYVAGALSLLLEQNPALSAQDAARLMLSNTRDLGKRGEDRESGRGLLDVAKAVRAGRSRGAG